MLLLLSEKVDIETGHTDTGGDGCSWYVSNSAWCGDFDSADFVAADLCVACGGGEVPTFDRGGDSCSWYKDHQNQCGVWDDEDFHAHADCFWCRDQACDPEIEAAKEGRDLFGDDCSWYIGNESSCGTFDSETFVASELCCACANQSSASSLNLSGLGEGLSKAKMAIVLASGRRPVTPVMNLAQQAKAALLVAACVDTDTNANGEQRFDIAGDGWDWYVERSGSCGFFDTETFEAGRDCCACGGGRDPSVCVDSSRVDVFGDGCDWYTNNPGSCGTFDHADFTAAEDCCACRPTPIVIPPVTYASNSEVRDMAGDSCSWYAGDNIHSCGFYNTEDFNAGRDCVECGGGVCTDGNSTATDTAGDGCDWYVNNPGSCGSYDDEDFDANVMCCACQGQTSTALNLAAVTPKKPVMNLQYRQHGACWDTATSFDTAGDGCWYYDLSPH